MKMYKIKFDRTICTGCLACIVACTDAHFSEEEQAQGFRVIKKFVNQEEGFQKNISEGCVHCGICISACDQGVLYRDDRTDLVLLDAERCIGCGACVRACPLGVIRQLPNGKAAKCDGCLERRKEGKIPACVKACPIHALTIEK